VFTALDLHEPVFAGEIRERQRRFRLAGGITGRCDRGVLAMQRCIGCVGTSAEEVVVGSHVDSNTKVDWGVALAVELTIIPRARMKDHANCLVQVKLSELGYYPECDFSGLGC
jgi:hypothetical protein